MLRHLAKQEEEKGIPVKSYSVFYSKSENCFGSLMDLIDPVWSGTNVYRCLIPTSRLEERFPGHRSGKGPVVVSSSIILSWLPSFLTIYFYIVHGEEQTRPNVPYHAACEQCDDTHGQPRRVCIRARPGGYANQRSVGPPWLCVRLALYIREWKLGGRGAGVDWGKYISSTVRVDIY